MISKSKGRNTEQRENMRSGNGTVSLTALFSNGLPPKCRMASIITLEKDCSIGAHQHQGECEIFYVLSGVARYNDNGVFHLLEQGDATMVYNASQAVEGVSDDPCQLLALIVLD